jgi:hypothetical protein
MSGVGMNGASGFMMSHRGAGFVRWRGALAFITEASHDPHDDTLMAQVLHTSEEPWTSYFADEWRRGHADAADAAHELRACEPDLHHVRDAPTLCRGRRIRSGKATLGTRGKRAPKRRRAPKALMWDRTVRLFRWFGRVAYARGIDRSPSHDVAAWKRAHAHDSERQLTLIHAWEMGWDEARDQAEQLALERRSPLEIPRVLDARSIHKVPPPERPTS